jgi:hypothetical protein
MGWLADGRAELDLAASGERLSLASLPLKFDFPFSFAAEEERQAEEDESGRIELLEEFDTAFDEPDPILDEVDP